MKQFSRFQWLLVAVCVCGLAGSAILSALFLYAFFGSTDAGNTACSQCAFSRFEASFERVAGQTLKFSTGVDGELAHLRESNDQLQIQFKSFSRPLFADLSQANQGYRDDLLKLNGFLEVVDEEVTKLGKGQLAGAQDLAAKFDHRRELVTVLGRRLPAGEGGTVAIAHTKLAAFWIAQATIVALLVLLLLLARYLESLRRSHSALSVEYDALVIRVSVSEQIADEAAEKVRASDRLVHEAKEAILAQSSLWHTVSHELRTPLQTIVLNIETLTQDMVDKKKMNLVARLQNAAAAIDRHLRDLMDYAKISAGQMDLRMGVFNPATVVEVLISNHQEAAKKKGLIILGELGNTKVHVHSDSFRFQQIVTNLLTNAIKYAEKGHITVKLGFVMTDKATMRLSVEDAGPGISPEDQKTLFDPFTQIDQSSTRRHEGVGLGLAIVKRLCELLGGEVKVSSELGRGSRFEVRLPIDVVPDQTPARQIKTRSPSNTRVLLVDDHADVLESLQEIIIEMGYQCDISSNGPDALKRIADQTYDLVLLDIQMPGMDGFAVAEHIRSLAGRNRHVPIVAISAHQESFSTPEKRRHFSKYENKPINRKSIEAVLQEFAT